jgi:hypothetical protein
MWTGLKWLRVGTDRGAETSVDWFRLSVDRERWCVVVV